MQWQDMDVAVKRNIEKVISIFYENPAMFLCEADVQAYLYSLLINDPVFAKKLIPYKNMKLQKESNTSLVHLEIQFDGKKPRAYERVDISILKPCKKFNSEDGLPCSIGIEIKYNRKLPARNEASNIIKDVKKVANHYSQGYVLWLNWDRWINPEHLKKVKKAVRECRNVRLYYLDLHSDPIERSRNLCNVIYT